LTRKHYCVEHQPFALYDNSLLNEYVQVQVQAEMWYASKY